MMTVRTRRLRSRSFPFCCSLCTLSHRSALMYTGASSGGEEANGLKAVCSSRRSVASTGTSWQKARCRRARPNSCPSASTERSERQPNVRSTASMRARPNSASCAAISRASRGSTRPSLVQRVCPQRARHRQGDAAPAADHIRTPQASRQQVSRPASRPASRQQASKQVAGT